MNLHNTGRVISFEVFRSLRRPAFWILSLAIPLVIAAIAVLSGISNSTAIDHEAPDSISFTYSDASGLIKKDAVEAMGGREVTDSQAAIDAVRAGSSDAFIDFPADLVKDSTRVYAQDAGLTENGKYSALANAVVSASVSEAIGNPQLAKLASSGVTVESTTFQDGEQSAGIWGVLPPLIFLVLFFLSITMLGNQMLNVTLEEKENRVTEMILTTINPTSLIVGKVIALVIVGIIQGLVFILPVAALATVLPGFIDLPNFDLSNLSIDPVRMVFGALLFAGGFLLFTGLLVAIGSIMPSAKEAGNAFGVIIIMLFLPLYAVIMIATDPRGVVAQIFTFFPLTAPVTALVRNATGSLYWWEALIVVVELFICATALLALGVRLFRTGSISYDARLNVRKALGLENGKK